VVTAEYALYLESGPRMRTTMVHVLDLLGCIANGPTTEAALEATPSEIRHYLRFLQRHGERVDSDAPFETSIVEHVTKGSDPRFGNPARGFAPDFEELTRDALQVHMARLAGLGEDLSAIARKLSPEQVTAQPQKGRAIHEILRHVCASEMEYVRVAGLGKSDEMKDLGKAIEQSTDNLADNVECLWQFVAARFEAATDEELTQEIQRGAAPYTLRRGLRRALEHPWEHLWEIERRLEGASAVAERSR